MPTPCEFIIQWHHHRPETCGKEADYTYTTKRGTRMNLCRDHALNAKCEQLSAIDEQPTTAVA